MLRAIFFTLFIFENTIAQEYGPKGEIEECSSDGCSPDIHSWTAQTWGLQSNTTRGLSSEGEDVLMGAPRSAEGKLLILKNAHDRIMSQIEGELFNIGNRQARGKGMGSTEGALITISLLTFAVYLIKLIMMLVDALHKKKGKAKSSVSSTAQPSLQTLVLRPGRKRRTVQEEFKNWQMLNMLENLNYT